MGQVEAACTGWPGLDLRDVALDRGADIPRARAARGTTTIRFDYRRAERLTARQSARSKVRQPISWSCATASRTSNGWGRSSTGPSGCAASRPVRSRSPGEAMCSEARRRAKHGYRWTRGWTLPSASARDRILRAISPADLTLATAIAAMSALSLPGVLFGFGADVRPPRGSDRRALHKPRRSCSRSHAMKFCAIPESSIN